MAETNDWRRSLEQGSIHLLDSQNEPVFVEKSEDGWTFFWNGEPGFRVSTIETALQWLGVLSPPRKFLRAV